MRRTLSGVVAAVVALALPGAAAAATHPLEVSSISPAPGTIAQNGSYGYGSQAFEVTIPSRPASYSLRVEVASANVPGQDGTLADDYRVSGTFGSFSARDSNPSVYTGTISSSAWSKPGTYYVQFSVSGYGTSCPDPGETSCVLMSPVYTYTVTAPASAPVAPVTPVAPSPAPVTPPSSGGTDETPASLMTAAQARSYVRGVIRREAKRSAHNLKYRCSRMNTDNFVCGSSWWDSRYVWAVTIDVVDQGDDISYTGKGLRASWTCVKRHSVDACTRRVRW